jgi:hypothetical protein
LNLQNGSLKLRVCAVGAIAGNGLAMHRKSIVELLIKQRIFIAFMVYEPLL